MLYIQLNLTRLPHGRVCHLVCPLRPSCSLLGNQQTRVGVSCTLYIETNLARLPLWKTLSPSVLRMESKFLNFYAVYESISACN
jgi:hypothetical protein